MMKCYMENCINNNEWACAYRSDCDYCSKDCKHYYKCIDCDYYMDESIEEEFKKETTKNKFKMNLTWHNCLTCPPEEEENDCLVVTDGSYVANTLWYKYEGYYVKFSNSYIRLKTDELKNTWWADIEQTVRETHEFKEN